MYDKSYEMINSRRLKKMRRKDERRKLAAGENFSSKSPSGVQKLSTIPTNNQRMPNSYFDVQSISKPFMTNFSTATTSVFGTTPDHSQTMLNQFVSNNDKPTFSNRRDTQNTTLVSANPGESSTTKGEIKIERSGPYPDLVILNSVNVKKSTHLQLLKRCFDESPYGPLEVEIDQEGFFIKAKLINNGQILAEGTGRKRKLAESEAVESLLKSLRTTNYFIEGNPSYFPKKTTKRHREPVQPFVLNPDPSMSHIYKVVCLMEKFGQRFPFPLSGAVHYVSSEQELWKYVEDHAKSGSKADLFVLNVDKSKFKITKEIFQKNNLLWKQILGCSNKGVVACPKENPLELLQDLAKSGGKSIKYCLIPPGSSQQSISIKSEGSDSGEDNDDDYQDEGVDPSFQRESNLTQCDNTFCPTASQSFSFKEELARTKKEEIEITPWIAGNLILMDVFNEQSNIERPKEIIFHAVRSSPTFEEFIIEKKKDSGTGLITGEALIDRKPVGRATARDENVVKWEAAQNALENLRKYCHYIEIKRTYAGALNVFPAYLRDKTPGFQNKFCRVVDKNQVARMDPDKVLRLLLTNQFEDMFFLEDFSLEERNAIFASAKKQRFLVRRFGKQCVCVSKYPRPVQVHKQLLREGITENEKYKIVAPPETLFTKDSNINQKHHEQKEDSIKHLFDFQDKDSSSTQTTQHCIREGQNIQNLFDIHSNDPVSSQTKLSFSDNVSSSSSSKRIDKTTCFQPYNKPLYNQENVRREEANAKCPVRESNCAEVRQKNEPSLQNRFDFQNNARNTRIEPTVLTPFDIPTYKSNDLKRSNCERRSEWATIKEMGPPLSRSRLERDQREREMGFEPGKSNLSFRELQLMKTCTTLQMQEDERRMESLHHEREISDGKAYCGLNTGYRKSSRNSEDYVGFPRNEEQSEEYFRNREECRGPFESIPDTWESSRNKEDLREPCRSIGEYRGSSISKSNNWESSRNKNDHGESGNIEEESEKLFRDEEEYIASPRNKEYFGESSRNREEYRGSSGNISGNWESSRHKEVYEEFYRNRGEYRGSSESKYNYGESIPDVDTFPRVRVNHSESTSRGDNRYEENYSKPHGGERDKREPSSSLEKLWPNSNQQNDKESVYGNQNSTLGLFQRRSDFRDSKADPREKDFDFYDGQKYYIKNPNQLWTKDVKQVYDQRF